MKALVYDEYATDNDFSKILKIKNIPEPKPKGNEVIFRVKAAALNYDDIWALLLWLLVVFLYFSI